jgi:hypothetical protein
MRTSCSPRRTGLLSSHLLTTCVIHLLCNPDSLLGALLIKKVYETSCIFVELLHVALNFWIIFCVVCRYTPYGKSKCIICKLHQEAKYCQSCSYKKGNNFVAMPQLSCQFYLYRSSAGQDLVSEKFLDVPELYECRCMCHVWKTSPRHKVVQAKQCLTFKDELLRIYVHMRHRMSTTWRHFNPQSDFSVEINHLTKQRHGWAFKTGWIFRCCRKFGVAYFTDLSCFQLRTCVVFYCSLWTSSMDKYQRISIDEEQFTARIGSY